MLPCQVAARLSALSGACTALEEMRKGGKMRETRLEKALSRLEKTEAPELALSGPSKEILTKGGATQQPASPMKAAQTQATAAVMQVWEMV